MKLLSEASHGVLGVINENGYPYTVPVSHAVLNGEIVFHCAASGQKLEAIEYSNKVSFCAVIQDEVIPSRRTTAYISVIAFGTARIVNDIEEMRRIALAIGEKFSGSFPEECRQETEDVLSKGTMRCVAIHIEHITGKCGLEVLKNKLN